MDAAYVKQSSFDKLTAGWFSREETAYWARVISPRVSPTSSMRLLQHVWIPTARECGSSCQLQADKFNIDRNEDEICTINFTLSAESNKLTRNTLNVFVVVNPVSVCVFVYVWRQTKSNTNYWASASVKCTAVVTVSARWTIELPYSLTVGGVAMFSTRQSAGWLYSNEHG